MNFRASAFGLPLSKVTISKVNNPSARPLGMDSLPRAYVVSSLAAPLASSSFKSSIAIEVQPLYPRSAKFPQKNDSEVSH